MKRKLLYTLLLCSALCGCGTQKPEMLDVEDLTDTSYEETADTLSDNFATDNNSAEADEEYVQDYFPAISEEEPTLEKPTATQSGISWVIFSINDSYDDVKISIDDSHSDVLNGTNINGQRLEDGESGSVIDHVSSCADFGGFYSASYDIYKDHLENEHFCIQPDESSVKDGEITEYSINYLDYLISAKTDKVSEIDMMYKQYITLNQQEGDFEVFFYPLSDENQKEARFEQCYIRGTTNVPTMITISIDNNVISVKCSEKTDITIETNAFGITDTHETKAVTQLIREF